MVLNHANRTRQKNLIQVFHALLLSTRFGVAVVQRSQNSVGTLLGYESYTIVK